MILRAFIHVLNFDFAGDGACTHFGSNFVLASDLPTFSKRSLDDLLSFGCRY